MKSLLLKSFHHEHLNVSNIFSDMIGSFSGTVKCVKKFFCILIFWEMFHHCKSLRKWIFTRECNVLLYTSFNILLRLGRKRFCHTQLVTMISYFATWTSTDYKESRGAQTNCLILLSGNTCIPSIKSPIRKNNCFSTFIHCSNVYWMSNVEITCIGKDPA